MLKTIAMVLLVACSLSAQGQLRINEVNTGTPDFVELYNCGPAAVDASGWTVTTFYDTGTGPTLETAFVLPGAPGSATTVVPAGGFLILEENGTPGAVGSLPNSLQVGFNYFWVQARTVGAFILDGSGVGVDYMFRDYQMTGGAPFLPAGTFWVGQYVGGTSDSSSRIIDGDTDTAGDWGDAAAGSVSALNFGQAGGCTPPPADWQVNSPEFSLDVDGVQGSIFVVANPQVTAGTTATMNLNSNLFFPPFDVAYSLVPAVGINSGGLTVAPGAYVNLNFGSAIGWLNGGGSAVLRPWPGAGFPGGSGAGPVGISFTLSAGTTLSLQGIVIDPANANGFVLSAASQVDFN